MSYRLLLGAGLGLIGFGLSGTAHAGTITVLGTDDIYNVAGYIDGTTPAGIAVTGGETLTFSVPAAATVTVNGGGNYNDADGAGSAGAETDTGTASISGIAAPTAGYIAGVFYVPGAPLPAALSFTGTGGTSFTSLSPALNQAFFVGDGLTGDGTGTAQTFVVPTGATMLYLGLTDACGYYGSPSCYDDNSGSFSVSYTVANAPGGGTAVPEPGSLPILAAAGVALFLARRRLAGGLWRNPGLAG